MTRPSDLPSLTLLISLLAALASVANALHSLGAFA